MKKARFPLEAWYPSEQAKRRFGSICQAVNEQGETVHLLGTQDRPLLVLADAEDHPASPDEIVISIDEAKADWSSVTTAAALGTRFRIKGKKMRAVLFREPGASHPAEKYLRSQSVDANRLARQLEELAREVRKLVQRMTEGDLPAITNNLRQSAGLIDRRFRELWRLAHNLPVQVPT